MRRSVLFGLAVSALALVSVLAASGCATRYPRRTPVGEQFPAVVAKDLEGTEVAVPGDFAGAPLLLLVAFDQDAQFDVDRWLLGLLDAKLDVALRELPTIAGFLPRQFSETIDKGMRGGIPQEDWGSVITVYEGGAEVAEFTGSEGDNNTRVVLLDATGKVVFFHDTGYSARVLLELKAVLEEIQRGPTGN